jgi:hypothetical protein
MEREELKEKMESYYRELLVHYIAHIKDCEGISFVDRSAHLNIELSNDQIEELSKLEKEGDLKYY